MSNPAQSLTVAPQAGPMIDQDRAELLSNAIMKGASRLQVELIVAIGNRYGLDPLLGQVMLIDGKPFVSHKGLLHIAHCSGQFDGLETTYGTDSIGDYAETKVYRKDMARPFTGRIYIAEYNNKRGAWGNYPRAMAAKVSESFILRRAFDISLSSQEEMGIDNDPPPYEVNRQPAPDAAERKAAHAVYTAIIKSLPADRKTHWVKQITERFGDTKLTGASLDSIMALNAEIGAAEAPKQEELPEVIDAEFESDLKDEDTSDPFSDENPTAATLPTSHPKACDGCGKGLTLIQAELSMRSYSKELCSTCQSKTKSTTALAA